MVHCGHLPALILILPLILIIAPSNTQGIPGCNSLLCQLLAERGQLPEVFTFNEQPAAPHKRVPGMEFVGKRAPGMEFLGKRALEMENEADEGHRKSVSQFYQGIAGRSHPYLYLVRRMSSTTTRICHSYQIPMNKDMLIFVHNNHIAFIHSHTFPNSIAYICTELVLC